ncbi:MAG: hypothetical protein M1608_12925, partial [Candidatus Omnitrophica bacterium]|nr:hypothetical protein [Candidatus Omnitrophota bacterium]
MAEARQWTAARFEGVQATAHAEKGPRVYVTEPFFSFIYDGKPSAELLKTWELKRASRQLSDRRTERRLTYTDPKTGLVLRCVGIEWKDFPTVEWTLYFKNEGSENTPILENIQALNLMVNRTTTDEYILHHFDGGGGAPSAYRPNQSVLTTGEQETFSGLNGRPTGRSMSYFGHWG